MKVGIIGGSGLYEMAGFSKTGEEAVSTPFGNPSDTFVAGRVGEVETFFLPRHGRGHRLLPSEINHRANIFGLKRLGVTHLVAISAVGSLQESYRPGDLLLPDQYFDRTKRSSEQTFFGRGLVAHVPFGDPVCSRLRQHLAASARRVVGDADIRVHDHGTYVNIEGPAFSTRAESEYYRGAGFDVIGMTSLAEAKLAREAEICYSALALITDYDCWRVGEDNVSADAVLDTVRANVRLAQQVLAEALGSLREPGDCSCRHALDGAVMSDLADLPDKTKTDLAPLLGRYL